MLLVQVQLAQFPEVVELVDTPDLGSGAVFACSMQVRRLSSGYSFTLWNSPEEL